MADPGLVRELDDNGKWLRVWAALLFALAALGTAALMTWDKVQKEAAVDAVVEEDVDAGTE